MSSLATKVAAACAAVAACVGPVAAAPETSVDSFWADREAEYRQDPRGPFTAIRADYLNPGDAVVLYAHADSVSTSPLAGAPAVRIALETDLGFLASPIRNAPPPSIGKEPIAEGQLVSDSDDLHLGRFLLSVDLQERMGRVLAYDPNLLIGQFHGFSVFPRDEKLVVHAIAAPADGETVVVSTSRGLQKNLVRAMTLDMKISGTACQLTGYREAGSQGALFVPFRDQTSGTESYEAGRYLRVNWKDGSKEAVLDFNHATNPWCAYSPYYNCVLPPAENEIPIEIRAGEKAPASHP
jgi:hypothetical protein